MKYRMPLLVGAALLAGAASLPAQAVSSASSAPHTVSVTKGQGKKACSWGVVCLYKNHKLNKGANAAILLTNHSLSRLGKFGFNDRATSVCNHTTRPVRLYEHDGYKGSSETVRPSECKNVRTSFNDRASSVRLGTGPESAR
ncbi:peptidase inhibitor family I36 protein [Streptomyces oryzae]|uniref:Peptidase inhibitor family I36 protein n=1 Tax=Streptomyces oryzae TaxID=1434886 RepID=A0ABS3XFM3_9ACTN|nr:peptidase inhibitor family I36 protein [Streptomyces oryzae]MBO8194179.1 peptidase inhibitor family I36 protein [Streptomyces oryzae]